MDIPAVHAATGIEEAGQPSDELALENPATVLRNEDEVIEQAVVRMTTPPELKFAHAPSIPQWAQGHRLIPRPGRAGLALGMVSRLE